MNGTRTTATRLFVGALVLVIALFATATPAAAQYGRTEGGYAGTALGLMGGSALGAALASAAGAGNPLLSGAIMATTALAGGYAGGRLGSGVGNEIDKRFEARRIWQVVGGVTGGLMGFVFMPGGNVVAKALGAAIGAAVGGWVADKIHDKANKDFNPRTMGALIGGVNGALLAGPFGAAVGIPLGYIGGDAFDKYVFVDPDTRLADWNTGDYWRPRGSETGSGVTTGGRVYDNSGFDREGFDRSGYSRAGYDREGYDRLGYNPQGIDRQGYDRRGFRVSAPASGSTSGMASTSGTAATTGGYDPNLYRDYWAAWSRNGGRYPQLDNSHWQFFPPQSQVKFRERYEQRYERQVRLDVKAYFPPGTSLAEKRAAYRDAIERFRKMATDNSTPADVRAAALQKLAQLEQDLNRDLGGLR